MAVLVVLGAPRGHLAFLSGSDLLPFRSLSCGSQFLSIIRCTIHKNVLIL